MVRSPEREGGEGVGTCPPLCLRSRTMASQPAPGVYRRFPRGSRSCAQLGRSAGTHAARAPQLATVTGFFLCALRQGKLLPFVVFVVCSVV